MGKKHTKEFPITVPAETNFLEPLKFLAVIIYYAVADWNISNSCIVNDNRDRAK